MLKYAHTCLIVATEGAVHALSNCDLARHITIECGGLVHVHRLFNKVRRANHPAHFPSSAVEHLARAVDCDCFGKVSRREVGKALILTTIKGQEKVDIVGEDAHLGMPVKNLSQPLDLSTRP